MRAGSKRSQIKPMAFNRHGAWANYAFEMARAKRTLLQSLVTPVVTTSLYFVVFGAAIGSRMGEVDGVPYGAFLLLTAATFSLFGFITSIWAKGFEQLQFIPMLIVTPLTFLGGAFISGQFSISFHCRQKMTL